MGSSLWFFCCKELLFHSMADILYKYALIYPIFCAKQYHHIYNGHH